MSKAKRGRPAGNKVARTSVRLPLAEVVLLRLLALGSGRTPPAEFAWLVRAAAEKAGVALTAAEERAVRRRAREGN